MIKKITPHKDLVLLEPLPKQSTFAGSIFLPEGHTMNIHSQRYKVVDIGYAVTLVKKGDIVLHEHPNGLSFSNGGVVQKFVAERDLIAILE